MLMMNADKFFFNLFNPRHLRSGFAVIGISILFPSCTPKMFRDLRGAGTDFKRTDIELFRPGLKESLVYKTTVQFRDKEFSSLTYFNELSDSVFKIVLLTN